ncbi:hypothetical protein [Streptomyces sp. AM6-12]|uniref:hypothetical protein n=1 Tax=Streptomyces sp. AM6-12 TaxID=3345149 RepID=UPI00379D6997
MPAWRGTSGRRWHAAVPATALLPALVAALRAVLRAGTARTAALLVTGSAPGLPQWSATGTTPMRQRGPSGRAGSASRTPGAARSVRALIPVGGTDAPVAAPEDGAVAARVPR